MSVHAIFNRERSRSRNSGHTVLRMRNSAACGADGVCIRMLKTGFPAIGVIIHIINPCITKSDISSDWKHSIVQPIFKSGNPPDPLNFRPISLVPVFMKIVERVIHQQLVCPQRNKASVPDTPPRPRFCPALTVSSPPPIEERSQCCA